MKTRNYSKLKASFKLPLEGWGSTTKKEFEEAKLKWKTYDTDDWLDSVWESLEYLRKAGRGQDEPYWHHEGGIDLNSLTKAYLKFMMAIPVSMQRKEIVSKL